MRQTIGEVHCPFHQRKLKAEVRRDKNRKLYYFCRACGPVLAHGRSFQEWMLVNGRLFSGEEIPDE